MTAIETDRLSTCGIPSIRDRHRRTQVKYERPAEQVSQLALDVAIPAGVGKHSLIVLYAAYVGDVIALGRGNVFARRGMPWTDEP